MRNSLRLCGEVLIYSAHGLLTWIVSGFGVYRKIPRNCITNSLTPYSKVFLAEVAVRVTCAQRELKDGVVNRKFLIFSNNHELPLWYYKESS